MGVIAIVFSSITSILGIVTAGLMAFYKGDLPWTDHDRAIRLAFYHRWFGYLMLLFGNATCMAGVINYVMKQIKQDKYLSIITLTLPLFLLIVTFFEVRHRLYSSTGELDFSKVKCDVSMNITEFHEWIKSGKRLVVLDNLVLDLGRFSMIHPGGKFALERTIGRDLSKFFYGGFHILSELGSQPPHAHSIKALEIAKGMVVAKVAGEESSAKKVVCRIAKKTKNNSNTHTFCFETLDKQPHHSFSHFFLDHNNMGRHYLLNASSDPTTSRQYTICNTMVPEFMEEMFKLADSVIHDTHFTFNKRLLEDEPQNRVYLTLKNYGRQTGLSARVHAQKANEGQNIHHLEFRDSEDQEEVQAASGGAALHEFKAEAP